MIASSGDLLIDIEFLDFLKNHLLPKCTVFTPNLPEAFTLIDKKDQDYKGLDMKERIKIVAKNY